MILAYFASPRRLRRLLTLALPLAMCAPVLAGCNDKQSETTDTRQTVSLPTSAAAPKPGDKKPAARVVPPPKESDLGIPVYPGAKTYVDSGGVAVPAQNDASMSTAMLETGDPIDTVADFYKQRLTETNASGATQPVTPTEEKKDGKRTITISGHDAQGSVVLALLHEDTNKTVIELMRTQLKPPTGAAGDATPTAPAGANSGMPTGTAGASDTPPASVGTSGTSGTSGTPGAVAGGGR